MKVPTLILQGTVDDLFTLDEGIANYEALEKQGTTVSMAWFCGGHGVCLTNPGTAIEVGPLSLAWMEHYVAKDTSVKVLKGFAFVDQNGTSYAAPSYPLPSGAPVVASGSGTLALKAGGGSGPPTVPPNSQAANAVDAVAYCVTPAPAANSVNITVPLTRDAVIVGAPTLSLTYSGTVPSGDTAHPGVRPMVDPATGIVVNNQITPIPVTLDGKTHTLAHPDGDDRLHRQVRHLASSAIESGAPHTQIPPKSAVRKQPGSSRIPPMQTYVLAMHSAQDALAGVAKRHALSNRLNSLFGFWRRLNR